MAYIVATNNCCHCKDCWNLADVPHETRRAVFTVREMRDDGFEYHVIPGGFATRFAAEDALKKSRRTRLDVGHASAEGVTT